ncbi:MAG TPA: sulfotransferase family 2 domain-containing protein, partial [Magnetospirillaceae bacterium]|nr:sulfotransferase family 2 domain-containing protein [Magnetospirillaceae bacterium]
MTGSSLPADRTVLDWLRYGSYVDERRRILYVETPKCGCSSIKYLLLGNRSFQFNPMARQTKLDMMIHDREQNPLPPLTSFAADRLEAILHGPGWHRFSVIRQPAERFFSAWRD